HRQALAAVFDGMGKPLPAALHIRLVGLLEALGRAHFAIFQVAAFLIAGLVERGDDFLAQAGAFAEDGLDRVRRGLGAGGPGGIVGGLALHRVDAEERVAQRSLVNGHDRPRRVERRGVYTSPAPDMPWPVLRMCMADRSGRPGRFIRRSAARAPWCTRSAPSRTRTAS